MALNVGYGSVCEMWWFVVVIVVVVSGSGNVNGDGKCFFESS